MAVKDLLASSDIFVKNELTVSGQVRVDGYVNADIPVRLLYETEPGKMEVVAQQKVRTTADGQILPVKLSYVPKTPGEHKITLEAVPQPGELVTTNNQSSTFINVLGGGLNVLYVEGTPRVEQKFLRPPARLVAEHLELDCVRIDARDPHSPGGFCRSFSARQI